MALLLVQFSQFARAENSSLVPEEIYQSQDSCQDLDLRQSLPPQMQNYFATAQDQRDSNLCYAYASADLLSFHLGYPVSALYLAFQYNANLSWFDRSWRRMEAWISGAQNIYPEGGFTHEAIKLSLNNFGVCPQDRVGNAFSGDSFKSAMKNIRTQLRRDSSKTGANQGAGTQSQADIEAQRLADFDLATAFPNGDWNTSNLRGEYYGRYPLVYAMARASWGSCSGQGVESKRRHLNSVISYPQGVQVRTYWASENSATYLNRILDGGAPIAVTMDSSGVHKPDGSESFLTGLFPDHVSLVMGRRRNQNNGQCEFLIRDSFGPSCQHLRENKVECEKTEQGNATGYYWIKESSFVKLMGFYSYLSTKNQKNIKVYDEVRH